MRDVVGAHPDLDMSARAQPGAVGHHKNGAVDLDQLDPRFKLASQPCACLCCGRGPQDREEERREHEFLASIDAMQAPIRRRDRDREAWVREDLVGVFGQRVQDGFRDDAPESR